LNYLAHIYLSGGNRALAVGNFIGDFVKGKSYQNLPAGIRDGVLLHRAIDSFTDEHPLFKECVEIIRPSFGRYAAVLVDIFFDHLLASNFRNYSGGKRLSFFAANFYLSTLLYYRWLPEKVKSFIFHFIYTNRLGKYASIEGMMVTFQIIAHFKIESLNPYETVTFLKENKSELYKRFNPFWKELNRFVTGELEQIGKGDYFI